MVTLATPTTTRRSAIMAGLAMPLLATSSTQARQVTATPTDVTEEMIRELERTRLHSLVEFDMAIADPLHAEEFQLINPFGEALSKEDYLGGLESEVLNYLTFEPASEIEVYLHPGVAVIRYRSNLQIVLDGTTLPKTSLWHTDFYEERNGQWQVVWSHATEIVG